MNTNRWMPVANQERVTFKQPMTDGSHTIEKIVGVKVVERTSKHLGDTVTVTRKDNGNLHVIGADLVVKRETAEQNLKFGTIRWINKKAAA